MQSAKSELQLNQSGLATCIKVLDWSTTVKNVLKTQCLNQKQCSKWPPPALTHAEIRDAMMHSSSNDNPLSSYAVLEVVEISHACTPCLAVFPTHLSQLDLNLANLKATVEVEWFWHFPSDCENEIFKFNDVTFTSSLCSVVQVLKGHFTNF